MVIPFFTARRRQKLLDRPFDLSREHVLEKNVRAYAKLPEPERKRLRDLARVLVAEKNWEACGGLDQRKGGRGVTDEMKLTIAAQAALLLLGLGLDPLRDDLYPNVQSVLVYPQAFVGPGRPTAPVGATHIVSEGFASLGEAWNHGAGGGPVILSWADSRAAGQHGTISSGGHNVVLHEFAHKLDMLDGAVNGTPLLESREQLDTWKNVMTGEYIQLSRAAALGVPTVLNPYGATNPGEFFAVATETFFEQPQDLRSQHPQLYTLLRNYYQQDPAEWPSTFDGLSKLA